MTDFLDRLTRFFATGALGELRYGARLSELSARYGAPWDGGRIHREGRWPHAFGFGDALTVFCHCRQLRSVSLATWQGELELPVDGGGTRTYRTAVVESELTAALTAAGCTWRTVEYENLPDQRTLEFSPVEDVWVALILTDRENREDPPLADWMLYKVMMWGWDHVDCPGPDPSLPDDGWDSSEL